MFIKFTKNILKTNINEADDISADAIANFKQSVKKLRNLDIRQFVDYYLRTELLDQDIPEQDIQEFIDHIKEKIEPTIKKASDALKIPYEELEAPTDEPQDDPDASRRQQAEEFYKEFIERAPDRDREFNSTKIESIKKYKDFGFLADFPVEVKYEVIDGEKAEELNIKPFIIDPARAAEIKKRLTGREEDGDSLFESLYKITKQILLEQESGDIFSQGDLSLNLLYNEEWFNNTSSKIQNLPVDQLKQLISTTREKLKRALISDGQINQKEKQEQYFKMMYSLQTKIGTCILYKEDEDIESLEDLEDSLSRVAFNEYFGTKFENIVNSTIKNSLNTIKQRIVSKTTTDLEQEKDDVSDETDVQKTDASDKEKVSFSAIPNERETSGDKKKSFIIISMPIDNPENKRAVCGFAKGPKGKERLEKIAKNMNDNKKVFISQAVSLMRLYRQKQKFALVMLNNKNNLFGSPVFSDKISTLIPALDSYKLFDALSRSYSASAEKSKESEEKIEKTKKASISLANLTEVPPEFNKTGWVNSTLSRTGKETENQYKEAGSYFNKLKEEMPDLHPTDFFEHFYKGKKSKVKQAQFKNINQITAPKRSLDEEIKTGFRIIFHKKIVKENKKTGVKIIFNKKFR